MNATDYLTVPQRLLLAAHRLEEQGQKPFTAEALAVRAWKDDRRVFGLAGFEELYMDSNKCLASLCGQKGLVARGWFVQPVKGKKLYYLSGYAKSEAARLLAGLAPEHGRNGRPYLGKVQVSKDTEKKLCAMLRSTAFRRHKDRMTGHINWTDARAFLALDPENVIHEVDGKLVNGETALRCGAVVGTADLAALRACREWVIERFSREIERQGAAA